jgi:16S rRNA (cytosine967-C5)-methyltransferase
MAAVPRTATAVSPARRVAAAVLRRVDEEGAYADRALAGEARRAGLDAREHAFATRLSYGAVQRRRTLDHVIVTLAGRPVGRLDPPVRDALRLGVLQLLFLDGVAPHAAVDQSVELAKAADGAGASGFKLVNAVLRRTAREGAALLAALDDATPAGAALRHSVPDWLAALWWEALGADDARALLAHVNEPAETALRVNTLVAEPAAVVAELRARGVAARPADGGSAVGGPGAEVGEGAASGSGPDAGGSAAAAALGIALPEALVVEGSFDVRADPLWASGALLAQSRAAICAARLLAPTPGERLLDLCAAPGGKTAHLAALLEGSGEVVAVERHPGRAEALRRACERLRAKAVRVETGDAAAPRADGPYDGVLVDPPCSGLGTLQGRPDLRWRASPKAIGELATLQGRILAAGAAALARGGALLYATCTISPAENERVVHAFLATHPAFVLEDLGAAHPHLRCTGEPRALQLLPHRDRTDGFFYARLRRSS